MPHLPYPRHPLFRGRDEIFTQLVVLKGPGTTIQALTGLCGIGKTQVALEYAYRHWHDYQIVLWLCASSYAALVADLQTLTRMDKASEAVLLAGFKRWLTEQTNWLLVLDQIEDLHLIDQIIPPISNGHVLLTTRLQATGEFARPIPVPPVRTDIGALLFLHRAQLLPLEASLDHVSEALVRDTLALVQEAEGLPLVIDQMAAYLQETRCRVADVLVRYRQQPMLLLGRRGWMVDISHPEAMAATLTAIFRRLAPATLDVLRLLTFFPPDVPLPMRLHGTGLNRRMRGLAADPVAFDLTMSDLQCFSLLRFDHQQRRLQMSSVVQTVCHATLTQKQRRAYRDMAASLDEDSG